MSKYNPWIKPDPAEHEDFVRSLTFEERVEVVEMMKRARLPTPARTHKYAGRRHSQPRVKQPAQKYMLVAGFRVPIK